MKIISVHAPKAGGSSVKIALANAFGPAFEVDYSDDPANPTSQRQLDPKGYFSRNRSLPDGVRCLHGHFHPGQFNLADTFLFTLLRHPVDNIVSIYFFWKMLPSQGQPLHDLFLARGMSILQMASLPLLQYLYSGIYFGGFDMSRFGLIGRHEDRAAALGKLSEVSGIRIDDDVRVNVTAASVERERMLADKAQMGQLHDLLAEDIRFYERWCG